MTFPTKGDVQNNARWIIPKTGPNSAAVAPFCFASIGKNGAWMLETNPQPMLRRDRRATERRVFTVVIQLKLKSCAKFAMKVTEEKQ